MYLPEPPSKRQRTEMGRNVETRPFQRRGRSPARFSDRGYRRGYRYERGQSIERRRASPGGGWGSAGREMRRPRFPRAPATVLPFTENKQFIKRNFRGALQEHLQREEGRSVNLIFNTDKMEYGDQNTLFISRCKWRTTDGEGYGTSRKEAIQQAALDIIQKLGLATDEDVEKYTKEIVASDKEKPKKKRDPVPIKDLPSVTGNKSYLNGNYRGALLEYLQKAGIVSRPTYTTREETTEDNTKVFIATCISKEGNFEDGLGHASAKKAAIHFASLDFMLKMGLLTMEEHLKVHPDS